MADVDVHAAKKGIFSWFRCAGGCKRKYFQKKEKTTKKVQRKPLSCFDGLWSCMRCLMKRTARHQENKTAPESVEDDFYYGKDDAVKPEENSCTDAVSSCAAKTEDQVTVIQADLSKDVGINTKTLIQADLSKDVGINTKTVIQADQSKDVGINTKIVIQADQSKDVGINTKTVIQTDQSKDVGINTKTVIQADQSKDVGINTKTSIEQALEGRTDTKVSDESFQTAPEWAEKGFITCVGDREPSFKIDATRLSLKNCTNVPSIYPEKFLDMVARFQSSRLNEQRADLPKLPTVASKTVTFQSSISSLVSASLIKRMGVYKHIHLDQLEYVETLGKGTFGCVELVTLTTDRSQTFALKCMEKQHIVELEYQKQVFEEKNIMMKANSPFMARLYRTFKDTKYVYLLMEPCLGGDLKTLLSKRGYFSNDEARFYIGCVLLALQYMHSKGIAHRDLKPANMLLDSRGYLKLGDFGISKKIGVGHQIISNCGTPQYEAPEVFLYKKYDTAVDFWSVGVIIYELLSGRQPFAGADISRNIIKGISAIKFSQKIGSEAEDIVKSLCLPNASGRLGRWGITDVKNHKWFEKFDWASLASQTMDPPFNPQVTGPTDSHNFNKCSRRSNVPPDETSGWDKKF